jgi:hypothetical protein
MSVLPVSVSPTERRRAREFADLLDDPRTAEGHELAALVALAATLRPAPFLDAQTAPRADFRSALRERLVSAAAQRTPAVIPAQQSINRPAPPRRRVRRMVATGVTVGLVAGAGAAVASTRALPGDSLYGLKRGIESAQLHLASSDLSRGRELLEQADHRLSEVESLAASSTAGTAATRARIATALTEMDAETRAGAEALSDAYSATGDAEALDVLDQFVADQRERLSDLGALLHGDLRGQVNESAALLDRLQTEVDALLTGIGGVTKTVGLASGAERINAIARESGDGWAVSRLLAQVDSAAGVSALAAPDSGSGSAGGGSGTEGGLVGDLGAGVDDALSGLTGAGTSGGNAAGGSTGTGTGGSGSSGATGPSTAGGGLGQGGAATVPTVAPAPTPVMTVPAPGGGSTPIATLPLPSTPPPAVTPPVSLPPAPVTPPVVRTPSATLPVCPPLTTC